MTFVSLWKQHTPADVAAKIAAKTDADVRRALARAQNGHTDIEDFAALLSPAAAPHLETMARMSRSLTIERFGRTMQLYAPLYLSNICSNICTYCGFSAENKIPRRFLRDHEIVAEGEAIRKMGFEHVLIVTGEADRLGRDYIAHALKLLRPMFASLSMEVQPLEEAEYASLAQDGLSSVLVYQETYDADIYRVNHLKGNKSDIEYRLETPDRLGRAGVKKIGLGALYGLGEWRTDAWFVGLHLKYLERQYWRSRYSVSFPRLRPHAGQAFQVRPVSERDLVQTALAFRLLSKELELSLSTRESPRFRDHAVQLGFTAMSAGSRTNPGGYTSSPDTLEQFEVNDDRNPDEFAAMLRAQGYEPVWKDWDPAYDGQILASRA